MLYIFDWDGTLMDSTAKIIRCFQLAIKERGLAGRGDERLRAIIGLSLPVANKLLYPDITEADNERLSQSYRQHFHIADQSPCSLYPGVERVLAEFREQGHRLAIATSKSRAGLDSVLANIGWQDYFDASRCADEAHSKPHPLMLGQLLEMMSVTADDAVMVGDTEFDLEMAANASMRSVAVTYGAHPVDRLRQQNPLACIDSFDELLAIAL